MSHLGEPLWNKKILTTNQIVLYYFLLSSPQLLIFLKICYDLIAEFSRCIIYSTLIQLNPDFSSKYLQIMHWPPPQLYIWDPSFSVDAFKNTIHMYYITCNTCICLIYQRKSWPFFLQLLQLEREKKLSHALVETLSYIWRVVCL